MSNVQQREPAVNNKRVPVPGEAGANAQQRTQRPESGPSDRTGESQANDDPSSAPESGDKEP